MFHHHVMQPMHHFVQRPHFRMPHFFGGSEEFRSNGVGNTADKATKEPIATGKDALYPDDCGRDDKNKGLLCFPDGLLCQNSKNFLNKSRGIFKNKWSVCEVNCVDLEVF